MKYDCLLTNPRPPGEIHSFGSFGPWNSTEPGDTPLNGDYTFDHADLGVFAGIAGILHSQGRFEGELDTITAEGDGEFSLADYKSALQELLQSSGRLQPVYVTVKEDGPDHRKTFTVEARLLGPRNSDKAEFVGRAEGTTKKKAEQEAARQLLEHLQTPAELKTAPARKQSN